MRDLEPNANLIFEFSRALRPPQGLNPNSANIIRALILKFIAPNPPQSFPIFTILVPLWFVTTSALVNYHHDVTFEIILYEHKIDLEFAVFGVVFLSRRGASWLVRSSPDRVGHCVVFLGKTFYSHSASISAPKCINVGWGGGSGGNPAVD